MIPPAAETDPPPTKERPKAPAPIVIEAALKPPLKARTPVPPLMAMAPAVLTLPVKAPPPELTMVKPDKPATAALA